MSRRLLKPAAAGRTLIAGSFAMAIAGCVADGGTAVSANAAERGEAYAAANCAQCHAVRSGETISPNAEAPTFDSLAHRPDMTRTALAVLLRTPHKSMPNYIIAAEDVDDLAAYLSALKP
jgi:mono/diheme cytochrome c family protein